MAGVRVVLYTAAAIGGLALAWFLYTAIVPEPSDLLPVELDVDPGDPGDLDPSALARAASANLGAPLLEGNRVDLLVNGVEIFPPMLEAIEGAERSVDFLTFVYWRGEIAEDFARALASAARRGVRVRVLLDAYGARRIRDRWVRLMEEAGCQVAWFHPLRWYHLRRFNNRTHRKVLVVDGRIGFTGGVGIASEWEGDARGPGEWRDDHFRVEGPSVRYLEGGFAENWRDATGEVLAGDSLFPPAGDPVGGATVVPLASSPRGDVSEIGLLYWLALRAAKERVDISTPYFLPDRSLIEWIAAAASRVEVRLLVPGERNDSRLVRWASQIVYERLLDAGVRIFEFQPSMLHAKAVLIDDRVAIVGSANFDNRSFALNDELLLLVVDSGLTRRLRSTFERDLARSREIGHAEVARFPWWMGLRGRLALLLREQL